MMTEYSAAKFFVHQARAADELRSSVFGPTWPSRAETVSKATVAQPKFALDQALDAARQSLEGKSAMPLVMQLTE
jgi:hypothetical protein